MRLEPHTIAEALLHAPGWARVGLTAPTEGMREAAAFELANSVLAVTQMHDNTATADQLRLAL